MKTETKITIPARTAVEHTYTCSKCGKPCGEDEDHRSSFDVGEAIIELKSGAKMQLSIGATTPAQLIIHNIKHVKIDGTDGSRYPEGANINHKIIDCCMECYETIVVPALVALGFQVREENTDW